MKKTSVLAKQAMTMQMMDMPMMMGMPMMCCVLISPCFPCHLDEMVKFLNPRA